MTPAEIYHRTYLPDGPHGPKCEVQCHAPSTGRRDSRFAPMVIPPEHNSQQLHPFAMPGPNPILDTGQRYYEPGQSRFRALQFTPKSLNPIFIVEKKDQDFPRYATSFEVKFSRLMYRGRFTPVVDNLTVVGHTGTVNGRMIWIPRNVPIGPINELVMEEVPLFVSETNPNNGFWTEYYSPYVTFNILTSIDGQILASFGMRDNQAIESVDPWILDVIFIGKGLADLGVAMGRRIVKSLMQRTAVRGGSRALAGATKELAEEAAERIVARGPSPYDPRSGMTPKHFKAFQETADETQTIVVVRNTGTQCTKLIEKGCPGKPMQIKFHTSPRTGVVTAETREHLEIAYTHGYYVVDADGIARREVLRGGKKTMEEMKLDNPFWEVEKGQVIDPKLRKPLVGDYDLMGVINPKNMGQNIALHVRNKEVIEDITSPIVDRVRDAANRRMDMPRVLHGAQDQYAGYRGGASVFYPNGRVEHLADEAAVEAFYQSVKREPITGAYPRPAPHVPVVDELATRRAARR